MREASSQLDSVAEEISVSTSIDGRQALRDQVENVKQKQNLMADNLYLSRSAGFLIIFLDFLVDCLTFLIIFKPIFFEFLRDQKAHIFKFS